MIELRVVPRPEPLVPQAAIAIDDAARALAERLLRLPDEHRSRLHGAAGERFLLVCGTEPDLPWCDGIGYLGRDPAAPGLLLPTTLTVDVPLPLFERFSDGLTTAEVAALLAVGADPVADVQGAERHLLELAAEGEIVRVPLGQDALWRSAVALAPLPPLAETAVAG